MNHSEAYPAGIFVRLVAMIVDQVILLILGMILTYVVFYVVYLVMNPATSFGDTFKPSFLQWVAFGFEFCVSIPYLIGFHFKEGATPGKKLFGIRLVDYKNRTSITLNQAVGRFFASILSQLLFFAGYFIAFLNPEKRTLHDSLSGTINIRVKK